MRIAARKILVLIAFFELCLVTGGADAEDAAHDRPRQPEQIARTVEGSPPPTSPASPGSYTAQNDLLTGPSLLANTAREPAATSWMAPTHPADLGDPSRDELGGLDDDIEVQLDPNEPKSVELSQGVRGKLRAKSSGALLGITVGFW